MIVQYIEISLILCSKKIFKNMSYNLIKKMPKERQFQRVTRLYSLISSSFVSLFISGVQLVLSINNKGSAERGIIRPVWAHLTQECHGLISLG